MKIMAKNNCILKLSEEEVTITWFFMTGMSVRGISKWMGLPEKKISYYKRRAMKKIGAKNNNEFIMWFLEKSFNYRKKII